MTKEEAKLVLDNARPQTKEIDRQFYDDEDLNNALDMAIKALEQQPSEDCVSRAEAIKELKESAEHHANDTREEVLLRRDRDIIRALPPVAPTHGTCKDCTKSKILNDFKGHSIVCSRFGRMAVNPDFYCADFEKRGDSDDI